MNFKKMNKSLLTLSLMLSSVGCSQQQDQSNSNNSSLKYNGTYTGAFDTVLMMTSYGIDQQNAQVTFDNLALIFQEMSNLFDIYNDYQGVNNLKMINDQAGKEPVKVDRYIVEMLHLSKQLYDLSDGEFDVTSGALLKVWHNYREQGLIDNSNNEYGKVPTNQELEQANACQGWEHIIIDDSASTVYIDDPCVSLDVGGIAKGFATEKMQSYAQENMDKGFIINAGGNSALVNDKGNGEAWTVGIANPSDPNNSLFALSIGNDENIVTSGDYQRYYIGEDGLTYGHIIDPSTLYPPREFRSVSIICEDSGIADGLSTILFTTSYQQGLEILEKAKSVFGLDELGAVWIWDDEKSLDKSNEIKIGDFTVLATENLRDDIVRI